MSPDDLMALMNEYLSAMTDVIESHGGYVDKYIGDSIVAMFGAPADDPAHAAAATCAALRCQRRLAEMNDERGPFADGRDLQKRARIGPRVGLKQRDAFHQRLFVRGDQNLASVGRWPLL